MKHGRHSYLLSMWVANFYLFLYIPFVLLCVFSFNSDPFVFYWRGATTHWYSMVLGLDEVRGAFYNSFMIAFLSALLSLIMATLFVSYATRTTLTRLQPLFYSILIIPEIVIAVGFLALCNIVNVGLGLTPLVIGHTLLGLGYAVPMIYERFVDLDNRLLEAAYDLGASRSQVISTIIIPLLRPALLSSFLLTFIVSFDDFVISFFCAGGSVQTLPLYIFTLIKSGASPAVAALGMLLLGMSSLVVCLFSFFDAWGRGLSND